jgi:hypothetical protein
MDGKALTSFRRNRIGLCVHHPLAGFAGRPCEIQTANGRKREDTVPAEVSPHQPFLNLKAISHEIAPGCRAEVRFDGEVFETEDHRNWTDAGFKTYGTPLSLPFPVEVPAGTVIRQQVEFVVHGRPPHPAPARTGRSITVKLSHEARPLPEIGVAARQEPWAPSEKELDRLRKLRLSHLRVNAESLGAPPPEVRGLGVPLEIVLLLGREPGRQIEEAAWRVAALGLPVKRWVVLAAQAAVTPAPAAALARELLKGAPLVGGTRGHFAELNRNRPAPGLFDGLCFPISPQVHAADNASLAENCAAQRDAMASARRIAGGGPAYATPVMLKPQYNPAATGAEAATPAGVLPPDVDARQMSLFTAAWTVASLKYLAEGGASGVTYHETAGWKGLMESSGGTPLPDQFRSIPGSVFPVWHALADVGEFRDGSAVSAESDEPLSVECLALRQGDRLRLLLASFAREERQVEVTGVPSGATRVRILSAANAEAAMTHPEEFRDRAWEAGSARLTLAPYSLAVIDFGAAPKPAEE